jgi:Glyoxalase superfamily protein
MSPLDKLKAEAATLQEQARVAGHHLQHCAALEKVAKSRGYASWRACLASLTAASADWPPGEPEPAKPEMKHYKSNEWHFALDIPARWNAFPAVPTNSPFEVVRFASQEDGTHLLIIFREPYNPQENAVAYAERIRIILEKFGFSNFSFGETNIGSSRIVTLDFDKPWEHGGTWSCRHYFVINGSTLSYTLGFGTNRWESMIGLYDQMTKSFMIFEETT